MPNSTAVPSSSAKRKEPVAQVEHTERPLPRNKSVRGFLPHEEPVFSTRGQHLPLLISHLSSSFRPASLGRRGSGFFIAADDRDSGDGTRPSGEQEPGKARTLSRKGSTIQGGDVEREAAIALLMAPKIRSMRLIGNSNPRYKWEQYWKTDEELSKMKKPIRKYYERNNSLIQQYVYIDRLLDSSLPHDLIQEYSSNQYNTGLSLLDVPKTISEEHSTANSSTTLSSHAGTANGAGRASPTIPGVTKVKRTKKNLYKIPDERSPLLPQEDQETGASNDVDIPDWEPEDEADSGDRIVAVAIYINMAANTLLLISKIIVTIMTDSVSVLAALVDAILDFLSTAIVWTTTRLISNQDRYLYPAGRTKLEPIGVLVFSVIMVTSFFQVGLEGFGRLTGGDTKTVQLGIPAIVIMAGTVVVKGLCWLWCRFIKNSSVQALAQDAFTDVIFNIFSIIFPLIGYYAKQWWLDPLGGILLSIYVILAWSRTTATHIRNLSGAAATADERNVLLYLTMRFAKTIQQIHGLQAYHAGDKLNIEVDIVLDEHISLRDAHDLGESLQYVLESTPIVERAFVHLDYKAENLPTHMRLGE